MRRHDPIIFGGLAATAIALGAIVMLGGAAFAQGSDDEPIPKGVLGVAVTTDPPSEATGFTVKIVRDSVAPAEVAAADGLMFDRRADGMPLPIPMLPGPKTIALLELPDDYVTRGVICRDADGSVLVRVAGPLIDVGSRATGRTEVALESLESDQLDLGLDAAALNLDVRHIELDMPMGVDVSCVFEVEPLDDESAIPNNDPGPDRDEAIPAPKPGKWRGVNQPATIACGGITTRLSKSTNNGRLEVKRGGRRLVARGLAENRNTRIVLDAVVGKPSRWRGDLKISQQGQSITLDYIVDMANPERLNGTMVGTFRVGGQKCTLKRDFLLTHRGN